MWRMLDSRKRQHRQISNISQQIEYDDNRASSDKRAHEIFSRIAYFAADKCHVCPRGLGEERTDHRPAKKPPKGNPPGDSEARLPRLRIPPIGPRVPPCRA